MLTTHRTRDIQSDAPIDRLTGVQGAIIYNNVPGLYSGSLLNMSRPEGPYVPVVSLSQENGTAIAAAIAAGGKAVLGKIGVVAQNENRTTANVIATSRTGNQNNIVCAGAHTDSVPGGPGINDNGSGTVALLELARQLSHFSLRNAVRFCFWTAEEFGLIGSKYYVSNLAVAEQRKIALYLNFDMCLSPLPASNRSSGSS